MPSLRRLSSPSPPSTESSSSSSPVATSSSSLPDPHVLAVLLAHIFDNNYSLLSVFKSPSPPSHEELEGQLGDLRLRWGGALPALWAYMWGIDPPSDSTKGKERSSRTDQPYQAIISGQLEADETRRHLLETTFHVFLLAAQRSPTNMFILANKLSLLYDFLLVRLYGHTPKRHYAETFPARRDWIDRMDDEEDTASELDWTQPSNSLRSVYHDLLRKLLEAGVDPKTTWRLFALVKTSESDRRRKDEALLHSGYSTPLAQPSTRSSTPVPPVSDDPFTASNGDTPVKTKKRPNLTIPTSTPPTLNIERLDAEMLDLLRHAMRSRWPDMFVFRGGHEMSESGIELSDMGRAWPTPQKGFNFSVGLIIAEWPANATDLQAWVYINRLSRGFTLFHVAQSDKTIFQIRILDNSQISLLSRPGGTKPEGSEPDEVVCAAPDALIAHQAWVHFSINCRKVKSADHAEARLFINGVRVGAIKTTYPLASPLAPVSAKTASPSNAISLTVGRSPIVDETEQADDGAAGTEEDNEIMLGRTLLLEEPLAEDLILLLHHLVRTLSRNSARC